MFDNNYNNKNIDKNENTNSKGPQFKNSKGIQGSTLVMQYWNDKLSFTIHPMLKNPTETRVYNYEEKINIALLANNVMSLIKGLESIIDKAIEENKEASVAVTTKSDNMVVVSTVMKENSLYVVLHICRELNPDTRIPSQLYSYTFIKEDQVIKGYKPSDGSWEEVIEMQSEYNIFKETLKEYLRIYQQAQVHSDRYYDKYYRDKLYNNTLKTGLKVGALDSGNNNSMFSNPYNNNSESVVDNSNYNPTTTIEELNQVF